LQTYQQLGDVREVAAAQHSIANALVEQGKVEEALSLYEQSLQIYQQLGDVREVAVALTHIGSLLVQAGEH
jgi:pentatricopeptide repeat protein